jgi:L-alanine-DL-glutamate epimerase-like enolase superfamily enzyme
VGGLGHRTDVDFKRGKDIVTVYVPGAKRTIRRYALVIETDAGERGEYVPMWSGPALARSQTVDLMHLVVGADPTKREELYRRAKLAHRNSDHMGFGPIDICLWDLEGKTLGVPISRLLGGYRDRVPAYASSMHADSAGALTTSQDFADFAVHCRDLGYRAFKIHGRGADIPWEAATYRALRAAVGPDMDLMTDLNAEVLTFADALKLGRVCDEAEFMWMEDPLDDAGSAPHVNAELRRRIKTPILVTELVRGVQAKVASALAGGTDFLRADPEVDLGITGVMKIAHAAEGLGLDVQIHAAGPAQRHCLAAIRNTDYYELTLVHPVLGNPLVPPIFACGYSDDLDAVDSDGNVPIPTGPGLGVTYDWDFIERHRTGVEVVTES